MAKHRLAAPARTGTARPFQLVGCCAAAVCVIFPHGRASRRPARIPLRAAPASMRSSSKKGGPAGPWPGRAVARPGPTHAGMDGWFGWQGTSHRPVTEQICPLLAADRTSRATCSGEAGTETKMEGRLSGGRKSDRTNPDQPSSARPFPDRSAMAEALIIMRAAPASMRSSSIEYNRIEDVLGRELREAACPLTDPHRSSSKKGWPKAQQAGPGFSGRARSGPAHAGFPWMDGVGGWVVGGGGLVRGWAGEGVGGWRQRVRTHG
jgi:hypothetical protein